LGGSTGVTWTKRNVSGKADSLSLSASALNLGGGTAGNGVGYDVNGKYLIPDWLARNQSLQASAGAIKQFLDAYDQSAFTLGMIVTRRLSSLWSVSAGLNLEKEKILQHECAKVDNCILKLTCVRPAKDDLPHPDCINQEFSYTLLMLPISA